MSLREKIAAADNKFFFHLVDPARDMDPDKQPAGPVRFVLEGTLPAKPVEFLKRCHLYAALSVAELETLPRSSRWRGARLDEIHGAVGGYRRGRVSIRGFMRFRPEDLDWMLANDSNLIVNTLPFHATEAPRPVPLAGRTGGQPEFAGLHQTALRRIVGLRFAGAGCDVDFRNAQAGQRFRKRCEEYRSEHYAVAHVATMTLILPDLLAWYLLQVAASTGLDLDEQELAGHAIAAARRLRRRVAGFHDRQEAVRRARVRLGLATKLVARMRSLARPCKRRDLARGFDNQRLDRLGPLIDRLVGLQVFSRNGKWLCMKEDRADPELRLEDFMEPLEEVPFSATLRLANAEQAKPGTSRPDAAIERLHAGGNHRVPTSLAI